MDNISINIFVMITNFVLKSLYKIQDPLKGASIGDMTSKNNFLIYEEMQNLSIVSIKKFLKGNWKLIYLKEEMPSLQDSFIFTFKKTYDLWKKSPCNILYIDPDVLFLDSVDIFSQNYTSCYDANSNTASCGVRYFPYTTLETLWLRAFKKLEVWDYSNYAYEQNVLYSELYTFGKKVNDLVDEKPINKWNNDFVTKPIVHFHSSHNPKLALEKMKYYTVPSLKLSKIMFNLRLTQELSRI